MTTHNANTSNPPYVVGDILAGKKTNYPHLDAVGDVGMLCDRQGRPLAHYMVIRLYPDPVTNEVLYVDIQLNQTRNPYKVIPNPNATCEIHKVLFPCAQCAVLAKENYPQKDP